MIDNDLRIMRIPLPVRLIREMDAVIINGRGGYATRAEFIVDAIQERVVELSIGGVEDAGPPPGLPKLEASTTPPQAVADLSLDTTVLGAPSDGFTVPADLDLSRPDGSPLFGLHNRDYPSLWVLKQLAASTTDGPIPLEAFYADVTQQAWTFGAHLLALENHTGTKLTALFPTNTEKRKSAEIGFRNFAIGDYRGTDGQHYRTTGPLFEWRAVGLIHDGASEPLVGLTTAGRSLLEHMSPVTVEEPHSATAAAAFMNHLRDHASADLSVFVEISRAIGKAGATRDDVLAHIAEAWSDWTRNEVSTNSAGYIARAREWGLVEAKQIKSKYHLTTTGIELANGAHQ
jgi:hypothetical protein